MPTISFTVSEIINAAITEARELSEKILLLADVEKSPLEPGEGVEGRHHKIAKLGKRLAVAFAAIDSVMTAMSEVREAMAETHQQSSSTPEKPDDSKAN